MSSLILAVTVTCAAGSTAATIAGAPMKGDGLAPTVTEGAWLIVDMGGGTFAQVPVAADATADNALTLLHPLPSAVTGVGGWVAVDPDKDSIAIATMQAVQAIRARFTPASVWFTGNGPPSNDIGVDGDLYRDYTESPPIEYRRDNGVWGISPAATVLPWNARGEWAAGTTYAKQDLVTFNGSSWLSRVDANTGNTPSTAAAQWQLVARSGDQILMGAGAPSAGLGVDGAAYIDTDNGDLYKKSAGAWGAQGSIRGPQGNPGPGNTLAIGTVSTGPAAATITGASPNQTLNLTLPKGDTGPANTLAIGTVQSGASAAATITGAAPNQTLNLTLPKGDTGNPGPAGLTPRGAWSSATAYAVNDLVTSGGSSYRCKVAHTNQPVSDATYWELFAQKGADGTGAGDMLRANNLSDLTDPAAAQVNLGLRLRLSADRTYYVRADGNDANTGLANTAGGAFATIQAAVDAAYRIDWAGRKVTIQLADGTYTAGATASGCFIGQTSGLPNGGLTIQGNNGTPANVKINVSSGVCLRADQGASLIVTGVDLTSTGSAMQLMATMGGVISFGNVRFGPAANSHVEASQWGFVQAIGNYTIYGGAVAHYHAAQGGMIWANNVNVTLVGTPNFSSFFAGVAGPGELHAIGWTATGSATGKRFLIHSGGTVFLGGIGGPPDYFPGSAAGEVDALTFGCYDYEKAKIPLLDKDNIFGGNIGIGSAPIAHPLQVKLGADCVIRMPATGSNIAEIDATNLTQTAFTELRFGASAFRLIVNGTQERLRADGTGIGFNGAAPVARPAVSGDLQGNAALASLLAGLVAQGLVTDATTVGSAPVWPRGYINGLNLVWTSATTVTINDGVCRNEDAGSPRNMTLAAPIVKSLSAWAAGNNNGGLDTGAATASTWYHVHLITKDSDGSADALLSLSPTAPAMPAGYTSRRRLGAIYANGAIEIIGFSQFDDEFYLWLPVINSNGNSAAGDYFISLLVPAGVKVKAFLRVATKSVASNNVTATVYSPDVTPQTAMAANAATPVTNLPNTGISAVAGIWNSAATEVWTDTSRRIKLAVTSSANTGAVAIQTDGWRDRRGR